MPRYRVKATYDMGMSMGSETYEFEAKNDKAAKAHLRRKRGGWLDVHKRGVDFDMSTLARVIGRK